MTTERTLLTADDLLKLPDDGLRRYELLDGVLVELPLCGALHGQTAAQLGFVLNSFVKSRDLGQVLAGVGVILRRNPDRVRAPDLCFLVSERIPAEHVPDGYLEIVPDLVVEIVSFNDTAADVQDRIEEWLRAGARLLWVVYPETRSVIAFRSFNSGRLYWETDTLDGDPVLPGFTYPVADLFS